MSQLATDTLLQKRQQFEDERQKMWERLSKEISEIDIAIESISGRKHTEIISEERYDDTHPDYVKQSQEEI